MVVYGQNCPSRLDTCRFRRASRIDPTHQDHVLDVTYVQSCIARVTTRVLILNRVGWVDRLARYERKVRLAQSFQHLPYDHPQVANILRSFGFGSQLVPQSKPVNTIERGVEMRLVDNTPRCVESLDGRTGLESGLGLLSGSAGPGDKA
jgi:hypothetical protein